MSDEREAFEVWFQSTHGSRPTCKLPFPPLKEGSDTLAMRAHAEGLKVLADAMTAWDVAHSAALAAWHEHHGRSGVWEDQPLPEDEEIHAAFPTRSGEHEIYAEALRLVGASHSKSRLVALVNWLLVERRRAFSRLGVIVNSLPVEQRQAMEANINGYFCSLCASPIDIASGQYGVICLSCDERPPGPAKQP